MTGTVLLFRPVRVVCGALWVGTAVVSSPASEGRDAQIALLESRMQSGSKVAVVLLLIAAVTMAVGYV